MGASEGRGWCDLPGMLKWRDAEDNSSMQVCVLQWSFPVFYFISCLSIFLAICGIFLCHGRTPVLVAVHPVAGSYLPTKRPWEGETPFLLRLSSRSFELLSLRISLHFGLGFSKAPWASTVFSFLIFCSYHIGVRYGQRKVNWEKQEQGFWQAFIQMEPLHWACSMGWGHLAGRRPKMGRRGIGSGRKSVHSWISELAHFGLSQSPAASQKHCLLRRTGEKRRVAVTWHKQELSYCILTKFHHYFGSIMSTMWDREPGTVLRKSTGSQNGHLQL